MEADRMRVEFFAKNRSFNTGKLGLIGYSCPVMEEVIPFR